LRPYLLFLRSPQRKVVRHLVVEKFLKIVNNNGILYFDIELEKLDKTTIPSKNRAVIVYISRQSQYTHKLVENLVWCWQKLMFREVRFRVELFLQYLYYI
jgi:hypothetical protein